MAAPKSRRPKPGRGLPPPYKRTPEEQAERDRLIAELEVEAIRLDGILAQKVAEGIERRRLAALRAAEGAEPDAPWS